MESGENVKLFFEYYIQVASTRYNLLLIVKNLPYTSYKERLSAILKDSLIELKSEKRLTTLNVPLFQKFNYLIDEVIDIIESAALDVTSFTEGISNMVYFKGLQN